MINVSTVLTEKTEGAGRSEEQPRTKQKSPVFIHSMQNFNKR